MPVAGDSDGWTPAPEQLRALGRAGRAFVASLLAANEVAPTEAHHVWTAARARDALDRLRTLKRRARGFREHTQVERLMLAWEKQFQQAMYQLTRPNHEAEDDGETPI